MITSIRFVNFKNFVDETLRVGPFTVIVGANASGKSNIRDAFRFLHGIGRGYTLAEIVGGKHGADWQPIRGATNEIIRFGQEKFSIEVEMKLEEERAHYRVEVGHHERMPGELEVKREELRVAAETIYTARTDGMNPRVRGAWDGWEREISLESDRPVPMQLLEYFQRRAILTEVRSPSIEKIVDFCFTLSSMHFPQFLPDRMREPALPGKAGLRDSGENLAVMLEAICSDDGRKDVMASWLRELTPMDVRDLKFPRDPSGRVHLQILEGNERTVSAYSASDGTLRFLALLALLLGGNARGLYFFEEIDTGIHPARQSLLLDLIERQAAKGEVQMITTTHEPTLLTLVNDTTFEDMSILCRLEDSDDAIIRRVAALPNARQLRKSGSGLGGLLMEGWMETALAFTEDYEEEESGS